MRHIALILGFTLSAISSPVAAADCAGEVCYVSALALMASPERFDGKKVAFVGVLAIEREGVSVYATPWHHSIGEVRSAVLIRPRMINIDSLRPLDGKAVHVVGKFSSEVAKHGYGAGVIVELRTIRAFQ